MGELSSGLRAPLTAFVGRHHELAGIAALLRRHRLVTLIGAGGCGKTRLATEVARALEGIRAGVVRMAELAPVDDGDRIEATIVDALGLPGAPTAGAADRIGDRDLLLLVDNCEHVVDAAAELVADVLRRCPNVHVLATSREPLRVDGEATWWVASLEPHDQMALFRDRAAVSGAPVGDDALVRQICRRLDGIPLAIELAAATSRTMTLDDIAQRLDDRFNLFVPGSRTGPRRHQTLLATVEWSERLLTEHDRSVLHRLSVFAGGFGLDAAHAICDADAATIASLVARSLVVADTTAVASRFHLLETIRQFGAARLRTANAEGDVRNRHLAWHAALARDLEARVTSFDDLAALDTMEREQENLLAALEWGIHGDGDRTLGLGLAGDLSLLWHLRGSHHAGREHLRAALGAAEEVQGAERAKALWGLGYMNLMLGDQDEAVELLTDVVERYAALGDDVGRARALNILGTASVLRGDTATGRQQLTDAVRVARSVGDLWSLIDASGVLAVGELGSSHYVAGRALAEEALALARRSSSRQGIRQNAQALGQIAYHQGRLIEARLLLEESLDVLAEVGGEYSKAMSTGYLALVALEVGELERAQHLIDDGTKLAELSGVPWAPLGVVLAKARRARREGDLASLEASLPVLLEVLGSALPSFDVMLAELCDIQLALGRVDEATLTAARLAASPSPIGRFAEARVSLHAGERVRAERLLLEGVALAVEQDARLSLPDAMRLLASLRGDPSELSAAADALTAEMRGGPPVDLDALMATVLAGRKRVARPASGWASLTPAEVDVVHLVSEGLTNPQVAARLHISRATVKAHLSHVFAKLEVSTRSELATMAVRRAGPRD